MTFPSYPDIIFFEKGELKMKLFAIIEEKDKNKVTELFAERQDSRVALKGFSVTGSTLSPVDKDILDVFKLFALSDNIQSLGSKKDYDLILDRNTGLVHFIKGGIDDLEKLFTYNGQNAILAEFKYKPYRGEHVKAKKFNFKTIKITLVSSLSFVITTSLLLALTPGSSIEIENVRVDVQSGISYVFSDEEDKFSKEVNLDAIKDYIYNQSDITNEDLKDYLYNPDFLTDVLKYYDGTPLSIISRIRHRNLRLEDFTEAEKEEKRINGYYTFDNILHIRDLDEENFSKDSDQARTISHEYIHLLQCECPLLIRETCCEIFNLEYYQNKTDCVSNTYVVPKKYVRILMEIIGTEPIWEANFNSCSTSLEDNIRPYLSDEEYSELMSIFSLSPCFDSEILKEKYPRLESLLNSLYLNKYGCSMYEDEVIPSILADATISRAYFKDSLKQQPNYIKYNHINLDKAISLGLVQIYSKRVATIEEYENASPLLRERAINSISSLLDSHREEILSTDGVILDGTFFSLYQLASYNQVDVTYYVAEKELTYEEYLAYEPKENCFKYSSYAIILNISNSNEVTFISPKEIPIASIDEKFTKNALAK